jgi:tetratricopeptide (TPR) repeat protein
MPSLRIAFLVVVASLFSATGYSQQNEPIENGNPRDRIILQVRVVSANDRPIGLNLRVELMPSQSAGTMMEALTNGQGLADMTLYQEGEFRLRVSGPGVETALSETFSLVRGEGTHIEFVRAKLVGATDQPAAAAGGVSSAASYSIPKDAAKEFDKGVAELRKNNWSDAAAHFQTAIDRYPKFDQAYDDLGIAKQNGGDVAGAKVAYQKAIELNDHNAGAQRDLARILEKEKNWPAAAELLGHSLAVDPNNAGSLTLLSIAQLEQGQVDEAISTASRVHALEHKSYPIAHLVLARAYELKSQNDDAIAQYRIYLVEDPAGPKAQAAKENLARLTQPPQ